MDEFTKKPVPEPILDQATRQQLGPSKAKLMLANLKEFYGNNKVYIWAILGAVVLLGVLGYFAFRSNKTAVKEAKVAIVIDVPETTPSGAELIYKIRVQDQDAQDLSDTELELIYPEDVTYVSSVPPAKNISGTLFPISESGQLLAGQSATLFIKTKARGSINDEKKLTVKLRYKFKNLSSEFIKTAEASVRIIASNVALDFSGPDQANNSQLVSYEVKFKNDSDTEITNSRIQLTYPESFSFAAGTPPPDLANNVWNTGTIHPGDSGKIAFQGSFKSALLGQGAEFKAVLQSLDQQGNYFTQAESKFITRISELPLVVTHELATSQATVNPGDSLTYQINYKNNATVVASGVTIVVTIDSKAVDLASLSAEGGQINNNTITWNAAGVPNLERLNPSEDGNVRFSFGIKNPPVKDSSKNLEVKTSVKIKANEYSTFLPGNDLALKIETQSELEGSLVHVNGELPPKVGKTSTYQVTLSLKNTTNDIENAVVIAYIPLPAGSFSQNTVTPKESPNVTFEPSTGKLTWKVGTLIAHTGDFNPKRQVSFNLQINPTASQVGSSVTLVKNISFSGKDAFTEKEIKLTIDNIETDDTAGGYNDGRVRN